jgi:hypothetical protein
MFPTFRWFVFTLKMEEAYTPETTAALPKSIFCVHAKVS